MVKRYPGTCRTDRCRWAASCSPAGAFAQHSRCHQARPSTPSVCLRHQPVSGRVAGIPPIARLGESPRREVGRPGCGSPAARRGEHNARLRPPSRPALQGCAVREFGSGSDVPGAKRPLAGVCRSVESAGSPPTNGSCRFLAEGSTCSHSRQATERLSDSRSARARTSCGIAASPRATEAATVAPRISPRVAEARRTPRILRHPTEGRFGRRSRPAATHCT
jgi:hypothetical protein